jgi:hypothetical protein
MGAGGSLDNQLHVASEDQKLCSLELQRLADKLSMDNVFNVDFSVTIADPRQQDCPLVGCSAGFALLTGYAFEEMIGRNCRYMVSSVPEEHIDWKARMAARKFCQALQNGEPQDDLFCVQVNATKPGNLWRNMFYLREISLDQSPYIVGLQAPVSDDFDAEDMEKLQAVCQSTFRTLNTNMNLIESKLAECFWYSAPMRRSWDN